MPRTCITDWSDSDNWSDLRSRRICNLASVWMRSTFNPFTHAPGTRVLVPWSWPSLFGKLDGSSFNTGSGDILSEWATIVVANGWHLFNGTPRIIFPNGDFSTYAVDLRINACADALADMLIDYPALQWIHGAHVDYCLNPVSLGAPSFADFIGDAQFLLDFDAGLARFLNRMRTRRPSWILVGQIDHRQSSEIEDPLNGYYLEQYIGKFGSQTSFGTVQGWIEDHATEMAIAHPGREQVWVVEYRNPRSLAPPPFGMSQDQALQAHIDLCEATGTFLSYERDARAMYAGHRPLPGMTRKTEILRPAGPGTPNRNAFLDANGALGLSNWLTMSDGDLETVARSTNSGDRDMYRISNITSPTALELLDVTLRLKGATGIDSVVRNWVKAGGTETFDKVHLVSGSNHVFEDPNVPCPDGGDWTLEKIGDGTFDAGPEATFATDVNPLILGELEVEIAYAVRREDNLTSRVRLDGFRNQRANVRIEKQKST